MTLSNVTAQFNFTSPRGGNLSSVAAYGADITGNAISCDAPVCIPSAVTANTTVACVYNCPSATVSAQAVVSIDGVQFNGTRVSVVTSNASDPATNCVSASVPLFGNYAITAWDDPWTTCATSSRTVTTSIPLPTPGDCSTFGDNYTISASVTVMQGTLPGAALVAIEANISQQCPTPSITGSASYTVTSSYNWCAEVVVQAITVAHVDYFFRAVVRTCWHFPIQ